MLSKRARKQLGAPSEIRRAFEQAERLAEAVSPHNVFNLSIGSPQIPPPPEVQQAMEDILRQDAAAPVGSPNPHGYMADAGYPHVRAAIAEHLNRRDGSTLAADDIIMTAGAACGVEITLGALLDPGDEAIVFAPYYPAYRRHIESWGGRMIVVPTPAPGFEPLPRAVSRAITPRTKAVIVNSPNNPSGTIYSEQTLEGMADVLAGTGIVLISDEPYRDLAYDGAEVPSPTLFFDDTVTIRSFSKSLSLPGERIGYAVVPDYVQEAPELRRAMRTAIGSLGFVNAPAFFQRVVARCLDARVDVAAYERNRDTLVEGLRALGFKAIAPRGGFFLFMKTPCPEAEFLERALAHNLVMVGGSAFGRAGYVRISFCVRHETIKAALPAFAALAAELGLRADQTTTPPKEA